MAGSTVDRDLLDFRLSEAIVSVREAFVLVDRISGYLDTIPIETEEGESGEVVQTDPLTLSPSEGGFGYSEDEAQLIRAIVRRLDNLDTELTLRHARKLTGLS